MELRRPGIADARAGLDFINSLVEEGADIGTRRKLTLAEEKKWLKDLLADKNRFCICAFDKNVLAGSVEVRRNRDDVSGHVAEFGINVRREYRGTGLARVLAKRIFAVAKRRGVSIVRLRVFSTNRRAMRFYRKLGFKRIAVLGREIKIGKRYVDAYLMERRLR